MGVRGPKAQPLALVADAEPLDPPADLDPAGRRVWTDIVANLPLGWITPANAELLRHVCIHTIIAREIEAQIAAARQANDMKAILRLTRAHVETSKHCARLLTKLRATPQSRYWPSKSRPVALARPWEDQSA